MNRKDMLRRLEAGENALELSIQKWQDIVNGEGKDDYRDICALCEVHRLSREEEYKHSYSIACDNCPVKLKTGKPFCQNSPWSETRSSFSKMPAKLELDFLKSLRKSP